MVLSSIAAISSNRVLGKEGAIPWEIPEDMRFFRKKTSGHILIMGRKTLETFPKLLPNRFHIILTKQPDYQPPASIVGDSDRYLVVSSADEALAAAEALVNGQPDGDDSDDTQWPEEVFNIGGGEIYSALLPMTNKIYLTEIDLVVEGDASFPRWHEGDFTEVERRKGMESETNGLPAYDFVIYTRQTSQS